MNITGIIKKISIGIQKSGVVEGRIETTKETIMLSGKLEGRYVGEFGKKINLEVQKQLPFKIELTKKPDNNIENITKEQITNFFDFWKRAQVLEVGRFITEEEKLCLEIEGILGKSYSSFASRDEIVFKEDLSKIKIIEAKNVPGLKDVKK